MAKCATESVVTNATVNSFMEINKLKLNHKKCGKIHIGKKSIQCPSLKVHEQDMKDSNVEKYLGDIISSKGTLDETIKDRKLKGYSYISEIRALLSDMPFGHRRIEVGLMLRDAMFVNGILTNSEVWHSITNKNIEDLEVMDRMLLRYILGAHAKVQTEFLYLETGATPLKQVITSRRLMYLQAILKRPHTELVRKVFEAQKENPVKGDWSEQVKEDLEIIGMVDKENEIEAMSKSQFKAEVRHRIREYVFKMLKEKQLTHIKIRHIKYDKLAMQNYLKSHMLNNHEASLLFSLRSKSTREFRANFPYYIDQQCVMGCPELDTPEHCIECVKLNPKEAQDINYEDLFSESFEKQVAITKLFSSLLERREDASALHTGPSHGPLQDNDSN